MERFFSTMDNLSLWKLFFANTTGFCKKKIILQVWNFFCREYELSNDVSFVIFGIKHGI